MDLEKLYEEKIAQYSVMYNVCVALLKFKHDPKEKQAKLKRFKKEILESGNNNRIKSAARLASHAKYNDICILDNAISALAKELGTSEIADEINEYDSYMEKLCENPKEYLETCLKEIVRYKKLLKEEKARQKEKANTVERYKNKPLDYPNSTFHDRVLDATDVKMTKAIAKATTKLNKEPPRGRHISEALKKGKMVTYNARLGTDLKEIILKHVKDNNPYIEDREIVIIKKEFGVPVDIEMRGYKSDDTISRLFTVRIVNEQLDRHEEVNIKGVVDSMDALYELALLEMDYYPSPNGLAFNKLLNAINYVRDRNYVEEYEKLYKKFQKQYSKFSKEEKEELSDRVKSSKLMEGSLNLPTPEEFRQKVNAEVKKKIDWEIASHNRNPLSMEQIARHTRYMTPEELAAQYHELPSNMGRYDKEGLQKIFIDLIERRMTPINMNLPQEAREAELDRRSKAISVEYLHEIPMGVDADRIIVKENYAKSDIELREAAKRKRKKFYNPSKINNAIGFMNYSNIKEYIKNLGQSVELASFASKEVLTDNDIERVKGLF